MLSLYNPPTSHELAGAFSGTSCDSGGLLSSCARPCKHQLGYALLSGWYKPSSGSQAQSRLDLFSPESLSGGNGMIAEYVSGKIRRSSF